MILRMIPVAAFAAFAFTASAQTSGTMSGAGGTMSNHMSGQTMPGCTTTAQNTMSGGAMTGDNHMAGGAMSGGAMTGNDHMAGGSMASGNHMAANTNGCTPDQKPK